MTSSDKIIHDMRVLADFYEQHPDHPRPRALQVIHDRLSNREELAEYAKAFGCTGLYGPDRDQAHHVLDETELRVVMILRVGVQ